MLGTNESPCLHGYRYRAVPRSKMAINRISFKLAWSISSLIHREGLNLLQFWMKYNYIIVQDKFHKWVGCNHWIKCVWKNHDDCGTTQCLFICDCGTTRGWFRYHARYGDFFRYEVTVTWIHEVAISRSRVM